MRWAWDLGFFLGSILVAFVQGAAVGAMIRGIPIADGQYAGDAFGWLHPFAVLTGIGLVLGYMRYRRQSIWLTVLLHGLNNLAACVQTMWLVG